jgi:hypothetical protein
LFGRWRFDFHFLDHDRGLRGFEGGTRQSSPRRAIQSLELAFSDGAPLAELGAAAQLARFFIVPTASQFLDKAAAFQKLLEAAQSRSNRFPVADAHP